MHLVTGLFQVGLPVLEGLMRDATGKPMTCAACGGHAVPVTLRSHLTHVCAKCGAMWLAGGLLHQVTGGRFGRPRPAPNPSAGSPPSDAGSTVPDKEGFEEPSFLKRLVTYAAHLGSDAQRRRYLYVLFSLISLGVMLSISTYYSPKPMELGEDGLPKGNMGMRPESAKAFKDAFTHLGPPGESTCPAKTQMADMEFGHRCEEKVGSGTRPHGPFHEWTCYRQKPGSERVGQYLHGSKDGTWTEKDCHGELILESTWRADKLHGVHKKYDPPGTLRVRSAYSEGLLHGEYVEFHDNGNVALEGFYHQGQKAGSWTHKDPQGRTVKQERF